MDETELLKKRKKKGLLDNPEGNGSGNDEPGLFEELEVDLNSDHPVHEKFVNPKKLRKVRE